MGGVGAYGVLIAVDPAVVEPGVGVGDADRETGSGAVRLVQVREVDVVRAEVGVAEWRAGGDGVAGRARTRGAGVLARGDGEDGGEEVVFGADSGAGGVVPDDVHGIAGGVAGAACHAEECHGSRAGDVDLLSVVAGLDEDVIWVGVVREECYCILHGLKVTGRTDQQSAWRASE